MPLFPYPLSQILQISLDLSSFTWKFQHFLYFAFLSIFYFQNYSLIDNNENTSWSPFILHLNRSQIYFFISCFPCGIYIYIYQCFKKKKNVKYSIQALQQRLEYLTEQKLLKTTSTIRYIGNAFSLTSTKTQINYYL